MDLSDIEISYHYGDSAKEEYWEIIRNVQTLLTTPVGTCPLYRDFGLDVAYLDYPLDLAQDLFRVAAMEAVERWEPRVYVTDVTFTAVPGSGQLKAKVVLADARQFDEIGF